MSEQAEVTLYQIAEWNWDKLQDKIDKMNKRAAKLGMPAVSVVIEAERLIDDPAYDHVFGEEIPKIKIYDVRIEGQGPKIEGYRFIGTLDHNTLPGSTIVQTVPGEHVPEQFYHSPGVCDHCGKIRRRNETFVLEKEDDHTHTQIGRQCVRDFIGHDPAAVARYLSGLWKLQAELKDGEWTGGSNGQWMFDKIEILKLTIAMIRRFGWVPRTAANPEAGRIATSGLVSTLLYPSMNAQVQKEKAALRAELTFLPEDAAEAEAATEWLQGQPGNNEYLHNLKLIADAEACPARMIGYWCSLVAAHQKHLEKLNLNKAQKKLNEYLGSTGDKIQAKITIVSLRKIDSYYGVTTLVRMLDQDGRTLVWFANTDVQMAVGGEYDVKGTVKKQEEYDGWKQTVLTRVKVI